MEWTDFDSPRKEDKTKSKKNVTGEQVANEGKNEGIHYWESCFMSDSP